jgi:hypothetical protein
VIQHHKVHGVVAEAEDEGSGDQEAEGEEEEATDTIHQIHLQIRALEDRLGAASVHA